MKLTKNFLVDLTGWVFFALTVGVSFLAAVEFLLDVPWWLKCLLGIATIGFLAATGMAFLIASDGTSTVRSNIIDTDDDDEEVLEEEEKKEEKGFEVSTTPIDTIQPTVATAVDSQPPPPPPVIEMVEDAGFYYTDDDAFGDNFEDDFGLTPEEENEAFALLLTEDKV